MISFKEFLKLQEEGEVAANAMGSGDNIATYDPKLGQGTMQRRYNRKRKRNKYQVN